MKNNYIIPGIIIVIGVLIGIWSYVSVPPVQTTPEEPVGKGYVNSNLKFSLTYPSDFTVNEAHVYSALGPGKEIRGVSFTIPGSLSSGTNLSPDSYLSVETLSSTTTATSTPFSINRETSACASHNFLDNTQQPETPITENGVSYTLARGGGAGAGNFYEEYVYALTDSSPCLAIRYFIHSTNIGNYEPGTVSEFDRTSLITKFDAIRKSLRLLNP